MPRARFGFVPIPFLAALFPAAAGAGGAATGATAAAAASLAGGAALGLTESALVTWAALPKSAQEWIAKASKTFANHPAGAAILSYLCGGMQQGLAQLVGPQFASLSFALPGLLRGDSLDKAWLDEFGSRVKQTIQYFAGKWAGEISDEVSSEIENSELVQSAQDAFDRAYDELSDEAKAFYDKAAEELGPVLTQQMTDCLELLETKIGREYFSGMTPAEFVKTMAEHEIAVREDMAASALQKWDEGTFIPNWSDYNLETGESVATIVRREGIESYDLHHKLYYNPQNAVINLQPYIDTNPLSFSQERLGIYTRKAPAAVVKADAPAAPKPPWWMPILYGVGALSTAAGVGYLAYRSKHAR